MRATEEKRIVYTTELITKYYSEDGIQFDTEEECKEYEFEVRDCLIAGWEHFCIERCRPFFKVSNDDSLIEKYAFYVKDNSDLYKLFGLFVSHFKYSKKLAYFLISKEPHFILKQTELIGHWITWAYDDYCDSDYLSVTLLDEDMKYAQSMSEKFETMLNSITTILTRGQQK